MCFVCLLPMYYGGSRRRVMAEPVRLHTYWKMRAKYWEKQAREAEAVMPDLLAACEAALDWYALDGDGISEPVRSQIAAAIARAKGDHD